MNKKEPLIILTGPTAAGKTDLSIRLAKAIDGEIISADSAQVYKGLDIGSAKVTTEEMQGVRHHLIDIYEPDFPFDVTVFKEAAKAAVNDILSRGKLPIIVGGTGFYIQALLYDIEFGDEDSEESAELRAELERRADNGEAEALYQELKEVDPESAEIIHMNNVRKVIRALEFYKLHGKPISAHNTAERAKESAYNSLYFVLTMDREELYDRINRRVDMMFEAGLVDEVKKLLMEGVSPDSNSMQAIGYKEVIEGLGGKWKASLDTHAVSEKIKLNTRHFAKRQLTWFRREKDVIWIDKDKLSEDDILELMIDKIKEITNE